MMHGGERDHDGLAVWAGARPRRLTSRALIHGTRPLSLEKGWSLPSRLALAARQGVVNVHRRVFHPQMHAGPSQFSVILLDGLYACTGQARLTPGVILLTTRPRRRQAGEGGISEYVTKAGPRFLIKYTARRADGTQRVVLKRGFTSRKAAAAALRAEIRSLDLGEWIEPTKQRLDAYLAEWVAGQRLSASTVSSYRKNIRLHIDPYLGETTLARVTGGAVDAWMRTLEVSGRADGRGGLSAWTVRYVYTILGSALSDAVRHGRLSVNPTDRSTPPSPSEARPPEMQAWTAGCRSGAASAR
jgi:hypothetical protein